MIGWDPKSYKIDRKPSFLISGEFHYFRVPKNDWKKRLELFQQAGGNCVATYIPWILHEPVEGDILFGDAPERDLEGFLKLCLELGIFVICRPGPYQYSEMKYDGLPGWLCENYPQILATDIHGRVFRKASVSYLHPVFLEKTKKWFDKVCPILSRYTLSKGGPVPFVQFDNELMGIHEWFSSGLDYNMEAMGFGKEDGLYTKFLIQRYENVNHLNTCYETHFKNFTEVRPVEDTSAENPANQRCMKDYQDFYFSTIAEYAVILTGWMRESGIDCDFIHNSANPNMNPHFLETVSRLKNNFLLGSDHYYNLDQDWESNNPTPKYAVKVFYSNEMLRLMGFPPTVFELPGGSASEWPPITPEDLKCCYLTNVALGMKGLNYYIFTGGPNPHNIGANGDSYDYGAPIGADNSIRPQYKIQKEFGAFLVENSWLANAERINDIHIGLDWEYSRSRHYCPKKSITGFNSTDAWCFLHKGLLITALCASYSPSFVNLYNDSFVQSIDKPLIVATSDCMAAAVQERLIQFVKNGGQLLLAPVIPYMDENFNPCTLLKEFLGGASSELCTEAFPRNNIGPVHNVASNVKLFKSLSQPDGAVNLAVEENSGSEIGWKKTYPGKGTVIWMGICWKHAKRQHSEMIKYVMEELNCNSQVIYCDNPNIWTSLQSDGRQSMLFIMNLFSSPMEAGIKVRWKDGSYTDTGIHHLSPMEVKTVKLVPN